MGVGLMASYRTLGYNGFLIRSINAMNLSPPLPTVEGEVDNYSSLGFTYNLANRELVLPSFTSDWNLPKYSFAEVRSMFPDFSISNYQISSYIGQDQVYWKWISDEAPTAGASETAWISPSSNTQSPAGSGAGYWVNQANAYSSDDSYASCAPAKYQMKRLGLGGFDFSSIPGGATITGLEMKCDCYRSGVGQADIYTFGLSANETIVPNNFQCVYANSSWPAAEDTVTIGGNGILWDQPLTKTYLEGCVMWIEVYRHFGTVTYYVDWLRLKAYYTT